MTRIIMLVAALAGCEVALAQAAPWHQGLCLGNGDIWQSRLPIQVSNQTGRDAKGEPVKLPIGRKPQYADLAGVPVESLRVCNDTGVEVLYNVIGPNGDEVHAGAIPEGSQLLLPVECVAGATSRYWAYFDNPSAWGIPDWLEANVGIRNGGFEHGDGADPTSWRSDTTDERHRIAWVSDERRSGKRSMRTTVDSGAPPSWVATRQGSLRITGGSRYVMRAWVKARDVAGMAGWYIHVGNEKNFMLASPMLSGGEGTYGWKEVVAEFTAPAEADRADLGTVLHGTGIAWFDDVSLECLDSPRLAATAERREKLTFTQRGADSAWYEDKPAGDTTGSDNSSRGRAWNHRVPIRVANFGEASAATGLISVDLAGVLARLRGRADRDRLIAVLDGRPVKSYQLGDLLLIEGESIPPHAVHVYYLYLAEQDSPIGTTAGGEFAANALNPALPGDSPAKLKVAGGPGYESLLGSPNNLVHNPSFETGDPLPEGWSGGSAGERPAECRMDLVQPGLLGRRCARVSMPQDSQPSWCGWRQDVRVEPEKSYLFAAWVKCEQLKGGLQLHAHFRNAAGGLCESAQMTGAGPAIDGTTDWTLISGLFTMPRDIANFQLHLTMNSTGTAWHDGALLVEVRSAQVGRMETRNAAAGRGFQVWQVNSIVKVFQDDVPTPSAAAARIRMARGEFEPLQLAVRSDRTLPEVRVVVDAPRNAAGTTLTNIAIGVVGYVPVDYPTNYYSTKTAAWVRKYPTSPPACDGWAGYWPDPLLPRDRFKLPEGTTQPVWVTIKTANDTPPGDYEGAICFSSAGTDVARIPFTVHVWDFELPRENHVGAVYDLRMDGRWNIPGKSPEQAYRDFLKFMADHRVCPDTIQPTPQLRYENGTVVADFTAFDKAAEYALDELGLPQFYTPGDFYLFGWGFPPSEKFGERPYEGAYPYVGADRGKLRPEFKRAYQAVLKTYWDHLKSRGWDKKCVLYISDEPFYREKEIIAQMKALCEMIHEVDPRIFIYCSTWAHIPEWDGYLNCWGIGHYGIVSPDVIAKRRAAGDRVRWTTDGQMCTDTPYCAVERLLPAYCFKYGAEAYEFWGINWLTYDPHQWGWHSYIFQSDTPENSYYVRYPNGDGFLAYPGATIGHDGPVTSIRLEQAREGCEDFEYLYLLRDLIAKAQAGGKDTTDAQKAMDFAQELVTIPNAGGRYSTRILPDPDRVFAARERIAEAIEQLRK